ncbi:MAG: helix-turn-helix domain-containing protein [Patescibacteria group bacterium]
MRNQEPENPIQTTLRILGGKWKPMILWHLHKSTLRFSELQKAIPAVSQKMLTQQLRELEQDGLVARTVYAEVPPRVEYSLHVYAQKAKPVIEAMAAWGKQHQQLSGDTPTPCPDTGR